MLNIHRATICAAALSAAVILSGSALAQRQGGGDTGRGPGASAGGTANVSRGGTAPSAAAPSRGASSRMGGNFAGRSGMRSGNMRNEMRNENFATSRGMRGPRYSANNYRGDGNWRRGSHDHRGRNFGPAFGFGLGVGSYYGGYGYGGGPYAYDYGDYDVYGPDYAEVYGPDYGENEAVQYCMQRFRSYDPQSGTYLGYDGERHPCP